MEAGDENRIVSSWAFAKISEKTLDIPELWNLEDLWKLVLEKLGDSLVHEANMLFSRSDYHGNIWKVSYS